MGNLLIVDDEPDILESLEEMFKYESGLDIDVYVAKSATNAVRLLEKIKFDVVMTDIKMPGMNGIEPVSYTHLDVYKRQPGGRRG